MWYNLRKHCPCKKMNDGPDTSGTSLYCTYCLNEAGRHDHEYGTQHCLFKGVLIEYQKNCLLFYQTIISTYQGYVSYMYNASNSVLPQTSLSSKSEIYCSYNWMRNLYSPDLEQRLTRCGVCIYPSQSARAPVCVFLTELVTCSSLV